jgi:hypothetical protein
MPLPCPPSGLTGQWNCKLRVQHGKERPEKSTGATRQQKQQYILMGFADLQTFYEEYSTHFYLITGLNKHPGWLDVDSDHFETSSAVDFYNFMSS